MSSGKGQKVELTRPSRQGESRVGRQTLPDKPYVPKGLLRELGIVAVKEAQPVGLPISVLDDGGRDIYYRA